jgi:hypothetical protein
MCVEVYVYMYVEVFVNMHVEVYVHVCMHVGVYVYVSVNKTFKYAYAYGGRKKPRWLVTVFIAKAHTCLAELVGLRLGPYKREI